MTAAGSWNEDRLTKPMGDDPTRRTSEQAPESPTIPGAAPDAVLPDDGKSTAASRGPDNAPRDARRPDPFGLDPEFERTALPMLDWLCRSYFRVEPRGLEHIPNSGRCLIVANHSGTLPLDGLMLRTVVRLEHPSGRSLRWLTSDFVRTVPLLGSMLTRLGAVRETRTDAERLVFSESLVAVFPEGLEGIGKLYRDRYRVQRFGGGGFVRLALRTQTPIIPCAIIGAEETSPMLYRLDTLPRLFGLPYLPITPTFPLLGPAGLIPAPTKWRIVFGPPLAEPPFRVGMDRDFEFVSRLANRVRSAIQAELDSELSRRRTIWQG